MIVQERFPGLRRRFPVAAHVLPDAGLTDVAAELEQFTMDAWRAPQRILTAHPSDQLADVWKRWPPWLSGANPPTSRTAGSPCDATR